MKKVVHRADSRGFANHGWLRSHHSFSFAEYYDPQKMGFGALRVLNDDEVAPKLGFGTHPHQNMEIISIPLSGSLRHRDNMGNEGIIQSGDVQLMSAGTGVMHSEFNPSLDEPVHFLQTWVIPNKQNVTPRYDQKGLAESLKENDWTPLIVPHDEKEAFPESMWIYQNAWFNWGKFSEDTSTEYNFKNDANGTYFFVIDGKFEIDGETLDARDAMGVSETKSVKIKVIEPGTVLGIEVPMSLN